MPQPPILSWSRVDTIAAGDLFAMFILAEGDARAAPASVVAAFLQSLITAADDKTTQYAAPSATGFTVTITNSEASVWLVLTPVAGYAAGPIVLPAAAQAVDKQEILVNTTQAVTALTVTSSGATVTGAPTTLAANAFFRLRFEGVTKTWYRVG